MNKGETKTYSDGYGRIHVLTPAAGVSRDLAREAMLKELVEQEQRTHESIENCTSRIADYLDNGSDDGTETLTRVGDTPDGQHHYVEYVI